MKIKIEIELDTDNPNDLEKMQDLYKVIEEHNNEGYDNDERD